MSCVVFVMVLVTGAVVIELVDGSNRATLVVFRGAAVATRLVDPTISWLRTGTSGDRE